MNEFDLINFLKHYNINYDNLKDYSQDILLTKNPTNMNKILTYLIIDKKIDPKCLEKCPSILYGNFDLIKDNYEFLENQEDIYLSNINNCLHILSSDFRETYYLKYNNKFP